MPLSRLGVPATILIVDRDRTSSKAIADVLGEAGNRCLLADTADAAWRCLQSHQVHWCVLNVSLPDESSSALLSRIKGEHPELPVFMIASTRQRQLAIGAMASGASGYVTKPVQREELLFHLERGLEWRQLWSVHHAHTASLNQHVRLIRQANEESIRRLVAATMCRDEETGAHIVRTGLFSAVLANAVGWSEEEAECLRFAAPLHDIGKIGIPDAILQKPARLTKEEYHIMKQHTTIGAKLLSSSRSPLFEMARQIALNHHERWDGTGYPSRISGDRIPAASRIVSIVDVYDALTHDRVYRPAYSEEQALDMMRAKQGTHFDPLYFTAFLTVLDQVRDIAQRNLDERIEAPSALGPYANVATLEEFMHRLFKTC